MVHRSHGPASENIMKSINKTLHPLADFVFFAICEAIWLLIYYVGMTSIGLTLRLVGYDRLRLKAKNRAKSNWRAY